MLLASCGRLGFEPVPPADSAAGGACVVEIAMGVEHACARLDDGSVWCWGRNDRGQLGNGEIVDTIVPPAHVLDGPYVQLVASANANCARRADGSVECWGNNGNKQLGPVVGGNTGVPRVLAGVNAEQLVGGTGHFCARSGQTVTCWGDGDGGQLGDGVVVDSRANPLPIQLAGVTVLATGTDHACMGTASGLSCWGVNSYGQLGVGPGATTDSCTDVSDVVQPCSLAPRAVSAFTSQVDAIGLGRGFSCALASGTVRCWGNNQFSELGDGLGVNRSVPQPVSGITTGRAISVGKYSGCASLTDGTVWCWGSNANADLGDGSVTERPSPVHIASLDGATLVSSASHGRARCAVRGEDVVCWGNNEHGIVAGVPDTFVATPTAVMPSCR